MTKIGFSGSRRGMTKAQKVVVKEILGGYSRFELHHGDCVGADEDAHNIARELEAEGQINLAKIVVHPPSNNKLRAYTTPDVLRKEKEYLERNKDIVNETDFLIACPNRDIVHIGPGGGGTWATVRYARNVEKPVTIVYLNGNMDFLGE